MTKQKTQLYFFIFLLAGIAAMSAGLFAFEVQSAVRPSVLFLGVLCGITALVFKIIGLFKA